MRLTCTELGGQGELLVVGPSLGTTARHLWGEVATLLADRFRVLAWELPGHGGEPATGFTVDDLAAAVLEQVDGPFSYAGVSIGGAVGQQLLLAAPERITWVALFSTAPRIGTPAGWLARAERVRREGMGWLVAESPDRWFGPVHRGGAAAQALLDDLAAADVDSYVAACEALAAFDVRGRLGTIATPVLAVAGAHDPVTTPDDLRRIADSVVHGRFVLLPDSGHQSPAEEPAAVAALIRDHAAWRPAATSLDSVRAAGMQVRRAVLGDAHVDRAARAADDLTAEFQQFITTYAWGSIWTRPGLDRRSRSLITLTALVAGGHHEELALHLRGALRNGVTREEIKELLLQTAIYCGVPAANTAFRIAQGVFAEGGES